MPLLKRRIAEYFLAEIFVSIVAAGLCMGGLIVDTDRAKSITMFISVILLAFYNIRCFMAYFAFIKSYRMYYKVNLLVFALFAIVSTAAASINVNAVFTGFFFPYGLLTNLGYSPVISALTVNGFMLALIILVPFAMPLIKSE